MQNKNSLAFKIFRGARQVLIFASFSFLLFACGKKLGNTNEQKLKETEPARKREVFYCWDLFEASLIPTKLIRKEASLPKNALPWGGTVSHHLLTHVLIDAWFAELAEHRPNGIDLFFILSPSHWHLSLEPYSLTDGSWKCKNGFVNSAIAETEKLKNILAVNYEPFVFKYEHGVDSLMPYIKKYFPNAEVVAIAYNGDPPVNMNLVKKLEQALRQVFSIEDARNNLKPKSGNNKNVERKNAFLLISTDFSHHSDIEKTNKKDAKSRAFLTSLNPDLWTLGICDNRPAMFILSSLVTPKTKSTIQWATNALALSNETDPEDITSYFFTFFWEEE